MVISFDYDYLLKKRYTVFLLWLTKCFTERSEVNNG